MAADDRDFNDWKTANLQSASFTSSQVERTNANAVKKAPLSPAGLGVYPPRPSFLPDNASNSQEVPASRGLRTRSPHSKSLESLSEVELTGELARGWRWNGKPPTDSSSLSRSSLRKQKLQKASPQRQRMQRAQWKRQPQRSLALLSAPLGRKLAWLLLELVRRLVGAWTIDTGSTPIRTENRGPSSADASSTSLGLNNIPIPVGRGPEDPGVVVRPTEKRTRTLRSS